MCMYNACVDALIDGNEVFHKIFVGKKNKGQSSFLHFHKGKMKRRSVRRVEGRNVS